MSSNQKGSGFEPLAGRAGTSLGILVIHILFCCRYHIHHRISTEATASSGTDRTPWLFFPSGETDISTTSSGRRNKPRGNGGKAARRPKKILRFAIPVSVESVFSPDTMAMAASQIVLSLESVFIVASAGLAPAAVAVIGHALGVGSLKAAKANAWLTIRLGLIAAVMLGALYAASRFLLPALYPKVGQDVLSLAFFGVLLMAATQPAKVLSSVLGNGVLASGSDTRFVLAGNLAGTYAMGLPAAVGFGLLASFGFFGVFAAKVLEEGVKATCFFLRFRGVRWYASALKEEGKAEPTSTSEL
jgi:hypothetical protein